MSNKYKQGQNQHHQLDLIIGQGRSRCHTRGQQVCGSPATPDDLALLALGHPPLIIRRTLLPPPLLPPPRAKSRTTDYSPSSV